MQSCTPTDSGPAECRIHADKPNLSLLLLCCVLHKQHGSATYYYEVEASRASISTNSVDILGWRVLQIYSPDVIDFQEKVYERSGLAEHTYLSDGAQHTWIGTFCYVRRKLGLHKPPWNGMIAMPCHAMNAKFLCAQHTVPHSKTP